MYMMLDAVSGGFYILSLLYQGQVARKAFVPKPLSLHNKIQSVTLSLSLFLSCYCLHCCFVSFCCCFSFFFFFFFFFEVSVGVG